MGADSLLEGTQEDESTGENLDWVVGYFPLFFFQ